MRGDAVARRGSSKNLGCKAGLYSPKARKLKSALLDAELVAGVGTEALGGPGGSPHDIDVGVADAGQLLEAGFDLGADVDVFGTTLRGEGHVDGDVLLGFFGSLGGAGGELNGVDEAGVDEVGRDVRNVGPSPCAFDVLFGGLDWFLGAP